MRCIGHERDIQFEVSDTGRSIQTTDLKHIFDLFWQAEAIAHMGTGFGLAISKTIVEEHGGKIWAESQPGVGTTFAFTIPKVA